MFLLPGFEGEEFKKLCKTNIMHKILRDMCSHPETHTQDEGFGELRAEAVISNDSRLNELLCKYTDPNTITDFWSGKTI